MESKEVENVDTYTYDGPKKIVRNNETFKENTNTVKYIE